CFAMSWYIEIIAAKLTAFGGGEIRRLIINLPQAVDLIKFIFNPTRRRRPLASLDDCCDDALDKSEKLANWAIVVGLVFDLDGGSEGGEICLFAVDAGEFSEQRRIGAELQMQVWHDVPFIPMGE